MYYYDATIHFGIWNGSCDASDECSFGTFEEAVEWAKVIWPYDTTFEEWKHDDEYVGWVFAHTEVREDGSEDYVGIRRLKSS